MRYFSQHPADVERRYRAYRQAIEPMQRELVRLMSVYPRGYCWFFPADGGPPEDMTPPWEESLPPEVRQHVENVRGYIQRMAVEYGFGEASVGSNRQEKSDVPCAQCVAEPQFAPERCGVELRNQPAAQQE